jgi:hypothetical protein
MLYFQQNQAEIQECAMDLTISLPNHVSDEARRLADEMGISVDQLFVLALSQFLSDYRAESVTEALDELYAQEPSALDPALLAHQITSIGREEG